MTVLFTDLVDSTAMRSRLGDDRADAVRREHDQLLTTVINEHRGVVVKGTGDGLMAVFHAPSEAVAAATGINQTIARRNRRAREPLVLRMGMSMGEVAVEDDDVFGTPVVEAARLCGKAANEQILVSNYVRALAGSRSSAVYAEVGMLELKGLREPILAYEILWRETVISGALPFPEIPALSRTVPFVGRRHELLALEDAFTRASLGRGPLVVIEGPAGVGCSRLAAEFALRHHLDGAMVLYGRCDPFGAAPFDPVAEALRGHVAHLPDDQLLDQLGPEAHHLVRLVPELAGRLPRATEQPVTDPQAQATAVFEAVTGWLNAASAIEPVVFVLDDLQWASRSTLLLLRHVLQRTEPMRVLFVATYTADGPGRPTDDDANATALADTLDELREGMRGVDRIVLRPPATAELAELAAGVFDGALAGAPAEELATRIEQTGAPTPFDAIWRLGELVALGAVELVDGRWRPTGTLDVDRLDLDAEPASLVRRSVRALDDRTRSAVAVAAVLGDEIEAAVLAAVLAVDDTDLHVMLDAAREAGVLAPLGDGRYRHTFPHRLVREAIYVAIDDEQLRVTHALVADELERQAGPGNTRARAAVAHHRLAAAGHAVNVVSAAAREGRDDRETGSPVLTERLRSAADAAVAAGAGARDQLALDEAADWYATALACLTDLPAVPEPTLLSVLLALGEAQRLAGHPEARSTLIRAAGLARSSGDTDALARAALASLRDTVVSAGTPDAAEEEVLRTALEHTPPADSEVRAQLLVALAVERAASGDPSAAELAGDAVAMARRLDDPEILATVIEQAILAVPDPGSAAQRDEWAEELSQVAIRVESYDRRFGAAFVRSSVALESGDLDTVQRCLGVARDAAMRRRHPLLSWHLSIRESAHAYARGDLDKAQRFAEGALELGQRARRAESLASFRPLLLAIRRLQGRLTELVPRLEQVFATDAAADGYAVARAMADAGRLDLAGQAYRAAAETRFEHLRGPDVAAELCNLAYLAANLGDPAGAAVLAERLIPLADRHAVFVVPLHVGAHYLAMLSATQGDVTGAHTWFEQAVRHHDGAGMPLLAAETRMEWARYCLAVRAPDHARQLAEQTLTLAAHYRAHGLDAQSRAFLSTLPPTPTPVGVGT